MSHSPLPWKVEHHTAYSCVNGPRYFNMHWAEYANAQDAELIVRCVNAHEALVKALKEVTEMLADQRDFVLGNAYPEEYAAVEKAREALKLAGDCQ